MVVILKSGALDGVDAYKVELELEHNSKGLPSFLMVGLAEGAVKEAKDRVFSALRASHLTYPQGKITANLAPADKKKIGSFYDLPLAVALLCSSSVLDYEHCKNKFFASELSLNGDLKPVAGILPLALRAKEDKSEAIFVAPENAQEAAIVEGLTVYAVKNISELVAFLQGRINLEPYVFKEFSSDEHKYTYDFNEVKGQEQAKRAIEIAAAGSHNLLFIGPPGSGKTMLAKRIPSVLPPLSFEEALEVTKIYSVSGTLHNTEQNKGLIQTRPFRSPHHTVSDIALVGGGRLPKPGEVSMAHRGVLFLDELPEFQKSALEVLRQPLEDHLVTISRVTHSSTYPANFMLVAAMNPCPCGYATDSSHTCLCSVHQKQKYKAKLSGPLLDRIDLHIEVPAVPYKDLRSEQSRLSSLDMRTNIIRARKIQEQRYIDSPFQTNADLNGKYLEKYCALDIQEHDFLGTIVEKFALSARAYTRILRIARTIADLNGDLTINTAHLAEAVNYRSLDRNYS